MLNLVFLPATEPGDTEFGSIPEEYPGVSVHRIHFSTMVWYNQTICRQAIEQIHSLSVSPAVLVGFSKSGLGAWNITRTIPARISATIIFDAPVAGEKLPPWGTSSFYADDAAWLEDLPIRTVSDFQWKVSAGHKLILISGEAFHQEMCELSRKLRDMKFSHVFLPRPHMKHHWQSGWIEEGIKTLLQPNQEMLSGSKERK